LNWNAIWPSMRKPFSLLEVVEKPINNVSGRLRLELGLETILGEGSGNLLWRIKTNGNISRSRFYRTNTSS